MASKNLIIAHDNPFNREVCGRYAHYFSTSDDLSNLIASTKLNSESSSQRRLGAYERTEAYSWEHIAEQYDALFKDDRSEVMLESKLGVFTTKND